MNSIIILADDLTGACDCAAQFTKHGVLARVVVSEELTLQKEACHTVCSYNVDSRMLSEQMAKDAIRKVFQKAYRDDSHVILKMDTALRGNAGYEIDALLRFKCFDACIVLPAIPDLSRLTLNGYQYIDGKLLNETFFADDRHNHVDSYRVSDFISMQSKRETIPIYLNAIRDGDAPEIFKKHQNTNCPVFVSDAETNDDIDDILRMSMVFYPRILFVGSLGLSSSLGRIFYGMPEMKARRLKKRTVRGITSSIYDVTARQIAKAQSEGLIKYSKVYVREANSEISVFSGSNEIVIVGDTETHLDSSDMIQEMVKKLAKKLVNQDFERLLIIGGNTAQSVLHGLGCKNLQIELQISHVAALGVMLDGALAGKEIVLKGGSVGAEDIVIHMICDERK